METQAGSTFWHTVPEIRCFCVPVLGSSHIKKTFTFITTAQTRKSLSGRISSTKDQDCSYCLLYLFSLTFTVRVVSSL